jgi:hypothetical protein
MTRLIQKHVKSVQTGFGDSKVLEFRMRTTKKQTLHKMISYIATVINSADLLEPGYKKNNKILISSYTRTRRKRLSVKLETACNKTLAVKYLTRVIPLEKYTEL